MSRPWMPLYVGDYLADTAHLRAVEHGAYLLLIMHYWRTQGLPSDDAALARIARVTNAEWKKIKPVIKTLFSDGWKHKRIEFEMTQAAIISEAGKRGGKASGAARRCKSLKTLDQNERPFNDRSTERERSANETRSLTTTTTTTKGRRRLRYRARPVDCGTRVFQARKASSRPEIWFLAWKALEFQRQERCAGAGCDRGSVAKR